MDGGIVSAYLKGLIAAAGAAASTLEAIYPGWRWLPAVTAAVVAVGVTAVPNKPKAPKAGS